MEAVAIAATITPAGPCQRSLVSLHKREQADWDFDLTISCGVLLPRAPFHRHESSRILKTPLINRAGSSRESSRHLVQTYSSGVYVRAGSKILSSRDSGVLASVVARYPPISSFLPEKYAVASIRDLSSTLLTDAAPLSLYLFLYSSKSTMNPRRVSSRSF